MGTGNVIICNDCKDQEEAKRDTYKEKEQWELGRRWEKKGPLESLFSSTNVDHINATERVVDAMDSAFLGGPHKCYRYFIFSNALTLSLTGRLAAFC